MPKRGRNGQKANSTEYRSISPVSSFGNQAFMAMRHTLKHADILLGNAENKGWDSISAAGTSEPAPERVTASQSRSINGLTSYQATLRIQNQQNLTSLYTRKMVK